MDPNEQDRSPSTETPNGSLADQVAERRELTVTVAIALVFTLLMAAQEIGVVRVLTEDGTLPYIMWRLIWPLILIGLAVLLPIRARIAFLGLAGLFWAVVLMLLGVGSSLLAARRVLAIDPMEATTGGANR